MSIVCEIEIIRENVLPENEADLETIFDDPHTLFEYQKKVECGIYNLIGVHENGQRLGTIGYQIVYDVEDYRIAKITQVAMDGTDIDKLDAALHALRDMEGARLRVVNHDRQGFERWLKSKGYKQIATVWEFE